MLKILDPAPVVGSPACGLQQGELAQIVFPPSCAGALVQYRSGRLFHLNSSEYWDVSTKSSIRVERLTWGTTLVITRE